MDAFLYHAFCMNSGVLDSRLRGCGFEPRCVLEPLEDAFILV